MSRERLYLFDTTLRDGAQMNGVDFTLADKLKVMGMLDSLGVDYVEGGYPGANPTDTALFAEKRPTKAKFTAFGMKTQVINGNDLREVLTAFERARAVEGQPTCIVALTHKGQGILKLLRKLGDTNFHGKPVPAKNLDEALAEVASGGE